MPGVFQRGVSYPVGTPLLNDVDRLKLEAKAYIATPKALNLIFILIRVRAMGIGSAPFLR